MKSIYLISVFVLILLNVILHAQEDVKCRVLLPAISEEYKGDCKKGLAHGEGVAKGIDVYVGHFKKGWPHKQGKYVWKTGDFYEGEFKKGKRNGFGEYYYRKDGKDTVLTGYWSDDRYTGTTRIPKPEYKLERKYNIERVRFMKNNNTGNQVRIDFDRNVMRPFDIRLIGSSGITQSEGNFIGFMEVIFPFEGKLVYQSPNKLNSAIYQRELEFRIEEPGNWTIFIMN